MIVYYTPAEIVRIYPMDTVAPAKKAPRASTNGPMAEGEPEWLGIFRKAGLSPKGPKDIGDGFQCEMLCPRDSFHSTHGHAEAMFVTFHYDGVLRHAECRHEHCVGWTTARFVTLFRSMGFSIPGELLEDEEDQVPSGMEDPGGNLWDGDNVQDLVLTFPTTKRLDVMRWNELRGRAVPPVQWDWEPFLPKVAFGIVGGGSGHGKSILVTQIAVAIATGLPLFGFPTGAPGGVGVLALEDDASVLHRRVAAAVEGYGDTFTEEHHRLLDANLRVLVRSRSPLAYLTPEALDMALAGLTGELEDAMETCEAAPRVVFIDTFNAVYDGDENSPQETRALIGAINGLSARLSCSVWALHHLVKTGTARNAPPIMERMDPVLVRGSGAIAAGVRGIIQLGWIYPKEAQKVGLEPENAARRYAIVGLTKVNDGPASPWVLLEHTQNAGLWAAVPNGSSILAKIKGSEAMVAATTADQVLLAVYEAGVTRKPLDRAQVAAKVFPEHKNPSGSLSTYLARLATSLLITKDKRGLTQAGLIRVKELLEGETDAA